MKTIEEIKLEWQCHNRDNGMSWNEVAELVNEVASLQSSEGEIRDDDMFIEANKEAVKYSMLKHGDEYSDPAFDRDVIETKIDFATGFVAGRSTPTEQPRESSDEKLNLLKAFRLWYDELSMEDEILVYGKWEEVFLSRTPTEQPKQESNLDDRLIKLIQSEKKLAALKIYKWETGVSLREAKEYIMKLAAGLTNN